MTASRLAAATSGIPWSIDAGMRWVPMSPFVDAPQMKKLPPRSQKSRERTPMRRPRNGRDRCGEDTAAAVRVACGDALGRELDDLRSVEEHVGRVPVRVPSLDHRDAS